MPLKALFLVFKYVQIQAEQMYHYENLPMQYTEKFFVVKIKIFTGKFLMLFLFLLKT